MVTGEEETDTAVLRDSHTKQLIVMVLSIRHFSITPTDSVVYSSPLIQGG